MFLSRLEHDLLADRTIALQGETGLPVTGSDLRLYRIAFAPPRCWGTRKEKSLRFDDSHFLLWTAESGLAFFARCDLSQLRLRSQPRKALPIVASRQ